MNAGQESHAESVREHVESELVRLTFGNWIQCVDGVPFAILIAVLMSGLFTGIRKEASPLWPWWFGLTVLWSGAALAMLYSYRQRPLRMPPAAWKWRLSLLWLAHGAVWGLMVPVFLVRENPVDEALLGALMLGAMVHGFFLLYPLKTVLLVNLIALAVIGEAAFVADGDYLATVFAIALPPFAGLILGSGWRLSVEYRAAIELRIRNEETWRALQSANEQLRREMEVRHAAESQVHQLQKMEAVGQLAGGIAHDFNNMLAVILGSLDLARRKLPAGDPAAILKYIDNATAGANRAATLTSRLLAFSRRQPLEPKPLDVNRLIGSAAELIRRTIGESIQVETRLGHGLWTVFVDAAQMETALLNLAVNSRDAMPEGGRLTIETANVELDDGYARENDGAAPGDYVLISVNDTGTGMAPEVLERAFDPFFTTKEPGKGTGLGLSQVFGFVKQSGGHIRLFSAPGRGTSAKIYLPRYVGEHLQVEDARGGCQSPLRQ